MPQKGIDFTSQAPLDAPASPVETRIALPVLPVSDRSCFFPCYSSNCLKPHLREMCFSYSSKISAQCLGLVFQLSELDEGITGKLSSPA